MRTSVQQSLEAVAVALIGAGIGYFFAPVVSEWPYSLEQLARPYMICGAIVGITGYALIWLAQRKWGNSMFRFSIREIFLLTVIVALICGWLVDRSRLRAWYSDEIVRTDSSLWDYTERVAGLETLLDQRSPGWRAEQPKGAGH